MSRDRRRKEHPGGEKKQPTVILSGTALDVKLARGQAERIEPYAQNPVIFLLDADEQEIYRMTQIEISQQEIGKSMGLSRFQVCRIAGRVQKKMEFFMALRKKLSEDPESFRRFFAGSRCQWCENNVSRGGLRDAHV